MTGFKPKDRPILMNGPMVRAVLDGSKTQTRRIMRIPDGIKPEWLQCNLYFKGTAQMNTGAAPCSAPMAGWSATCPLGQPGDRLWVREAWRSYASLDDIPPRNIAQGAGIQYEAGGSNLNGREKVEGMGKYRPSMFMPHWASRITLEITNIRVEQLQDISEEDAATEGIYLHADGNYTNYLSETGYALNAKSSFSSLWESINGPGSWDTNPWVWVVEFKAVKA